MTELNQKLKNMPRAQLLRSIYTRGEIFMQKIGAKEGEGICSKEAYCQEVTVLTMALLAVTPIKQSQFLCQLVDTT